MKKHTTKNVIAGTTLALMALGQSSFAALLVQDSFTTGGGTNYDDAAALVGQGPSGTTGFTGNYVGSSGWGDVSTVGLSSSISGYVGSSGGSINNPGAHGRAGHELASGFDGSSTGSYYLSFLMDLSVLGAGVNTGYRAFETHTNSGLGDGDRNLQIGIHNDGQFGASDTIGIRVGGSTIALGNVNVDTGANLFLVKFELSSTAASDIVTAWMNPTLTATGDPTGGQSLTGRDVAFSFLSLGDFGNGTMAIDEIRIGTDISEVVGVPEPSAASLLGLVGLALLLRRRK